MNFEKTCGTYDKCAVLLLVSPRETTHSLKDLYARVLIHIERNIIIRSATERPVSLITFHYRRKCNSRTQLKGLHVPLRSES